jgi:hypothetical protein
MTARRIRHPNLRRTAQPTKTGAKRGRPRTNFSPTSTTARGYGAAHQQRRRQWAPQVAMGYVRCGRCGGVIAPEEQWDLGHLDGYAKELNLSAPEHAACNRRKIPRRQQTQAKALDWFNTD